MTTTINFKNLKEVTLGKRVEAYRLTTNEEGAMKWRHKSWNQLKKAHTSAEILSVNAEDFNKFESGVTSWLTFKFNNEQYKLVIKELICESAGSQKMKRAEALKYNAYSVGKNDGKTVKTSFALATQSKASEDMINVFGETIGQSYCTVAKPYEDAELMMQLRRAVIDGLALTKWGPYYKYNIEGVWAPLYIKEQECAPSKWARMLKKESSINKYGTLCRVTVGSAAANNNGIICFVAADRKEEYERKMGYGLSVRELLELIYEMGVIAYNKIAKELSRVNMHSQFEKAIENSSFAECGVLIVPENTFGDGQFVTNFNGEARVFQARGYNSAIKGMAINAKEIFDNYMSKINAGEIPVINTLGNKDRIVAIVGEDSVKVKIAIAADTKWYIMHSITDVNDTFASEVTINKFGYFAPMTWAEDYAIEYYGEKLREKFIPQPESDYLDARFYGLNRRITINAADKFIEELKELADNGKYQFPIGGKVGKILLSDNTTRMTTILVGNKRYPIVDIRFMKPGLVLLRRVPDVGSAEWIIAYNSPFYYFAKGMITSVSNNVIYIPNGEEGKIMAETAGGFDYDGDSMAVYQLSVSDKIAPCDNGALIGAKTTMGEWFIGKYEPIMTKVVTPQRQMLKRIKSAEDFILASQFGAESASIGAIVNAFTKAIYMATDAYSTVWNGGKQWEAPADLYDDVVTEQWCVDNITAIIDKDGKALVHVNPANIKDFRFMLGKAGRFYSEVETGFGKSGVHPEQIALRSFIKFINTAYKGGAYKHNDHFSFNRVVEKLSDYKNKMIAQADKDLIWTCGNDDIVIDDRNTTAQLINMVDRAKRVGHVEEAKNYIGNHIASIKVLAERENVLQVIRSLGRETSYIQLVDDFLEEATYTVENRTEYEDNGMRVVRIGGVAEDKKISAANMFIISAKIKETLHKVAQVSGLEMEGKYGINYPMVDFSGLTIEDGEYSINHIFEGDLYPYKNEKVRDIVLFLQKK